jgi:hypothetical protein
VESVVNWGKIIWLALALFAAQFLIGLIEGILSDPNTYLTWALVGYTASLAVCVTIFASFAIRTPNKPFTHAWLGLLLQVVFAVFSSVVLAQWLGRNPWLSVIMEWVVLVAALVVGTSLGIGLRRRPNRPADA